MAGVTKLNVRILAVLLASLITGAQTMGAGGYCGALSDRGPLASAMRSMKADTALHLDASRFPLQHKARIFALGGGNRGFGVLAQYEKAPVEIAVVRSTRVSSKEPYTPACTIRVVNPEGVAVAVKDISAQQSGAQTYIIPLGKGSAGVWRISVAGGRTGDFFTVGLPQTKIWGVRGEMALWLTPESMDKYLLHIPPEAGRVYVEKWGSDEPLVITAQDGGIIGEITERTERNRRLLKIDFPHKEQVLEIDVSKCKNDALAFDGVAGLLCPDAKSAAALTGGMVRHKGMLFHGPLQARVRAIMERIASTDLAIDFKFADKAPAFLSAPQKECLLFGKYAPLSGITHALAGQVTDPSSGYLGVLYPHAGHKKVKPAGSLSFSSYPGAIGTMNYHGLANALTADLKLNPAYNNRALLGRVVLSAFYFLQTMQGDDVLRESSFEHNSYPMTHAFFIYPAQAETLLLCHDLLDEDTRKIWKEAVVAIGDKLADFQAYESNQWYHMIVGHLHTYILSGEERFLRRFEEQTKAMLNNRYGPNSKFGLHPAGYFLEEYGPDGNYDHLNTFCLLSSYHAYRGLDNADAKLVSLMKQSIIRNLDFKKFFWLPQLNGTVIAPTAFNCRTTGDLATPSYPGDHLSSSEFDLSFTRRKMYKMPSRGIGSAAIMPQEANTDKWAKNVIDTLLPGKGSRFKNTSASGGWLDELLVAFSLPVTANEVELPHMKESGFWELPGMFAVKTGGLYLVNFYDVEGGAKRRKGIGLYGGGPDALWSKESGSFVNSMMPTSRKVKSVDDLTFSCVAGHINGKFYMSGKEKTKLKKSPEGLYVLVSDLGASKDGLSWSYQFKDGKIIIGVKHNSDLEDTFVNIPFYETTLQKIKDGKYRCETGTVLIDVVSSHEAVIGNRLPLPYNRFITPLQIPLQKNEEVLITLSTDKNGK